MNAPTELPEPTFNMTHESTEPIEHVTWNGQFIATILRQDFRPDQTTFITPDAYYQQTGLVVYPAGGVIKRHLHLPLQRHLIGTPEAILVRVGSVEVDLVGLDRTPLGTWVLKQGDLIILAGGGHGFRCLENTILLEVKQGPYTGLKEKEFF
jgi:hypothetical protein